MSDYESLRDKDYGGDEGVITSRKTQLDFNEGVFLEGLKKSDYIHKDNDTRTIVVYEEETL